jgi:hypothetical protein
MSDIKSTFIILKTLLFFVFLVSGYFLSKTKSQSQYWRLSLIPIISFAIISGFRFGRDVDYNGYYFKYININNSDETEILYIYLVKILRYFDIPYYIFIFICSTFLIISFLFLLCRFRQSMIFILPLFLGFSSIENLTRWYLAFSFILIGLNFLLDKRYFITLIFVLVACFFHKGIFICIFIIALFYFLNHKLIINNIIGVLLLFLSNFFGSTKQLVFIASFLNIFSGIGDSKTNSYIDNSQIIANGEMVSGVYMTGPLTLIIIFISYVFPIYYSDLYFKNNFNKVKNIKWIFNLGIFTLIINPIFSLVDVFNRITESLMILSLIPIGIITSYFYIHKKKYFLINILLLMCYCSSIFLILRHPFNLKNDSKMMFIWDAKGRNYLP